MSDREYFVAGDGCRLAYRFEGTPSAPILVLSNSIATTLEMWDAQMPALLETFAMLRYDGRGLGQSDAPVGAYSLDRLGRDVLELLDHLGIARAHYCGLSLGGLVGQWLGVHAPDRIDRLVLSNTSSWLGPAPQWDALIRDARNATDMGQFADMFLGSWFPPQLQTADNPVVAAFRTMVLTTSPRGLAGNFAAIRDADMRRTVQLVTAPTLVVGGTSDPVTSPDHSRSIAAAIPGATLALIDGVHMLNIERQDAFLAAVMPFLTAT